ncbi:MAG TPA: hypothetical protein VM097_00785 [Mycobacteriales bacterium]|nr:hypothetical protein [Mycobacteriales bacterium]
MHLGGGSRLAVAGTSVLTVVLLAAAAPAVSKVRPVCRLVSDARGDAGSAAVSQVPGGDTDDLLSADIASDGRTVTAVLRLADVQVPDPMSPGGRAYAFYFQLRGSATRYALTARTYPTGTRYHYGYLAKDAATNTYLTLLGEATGSVSTATDQVRVHAPAAGFRVPALRRGTALTELSAITYRWVGQGLVGNQDAGPVVIPLLGVGLVFDEATGDRYVIGTPSCVRPGT